MTILVLVVLVAFVFVKRRRRRRWADQRAVLLALPDTIDIVAAAVRAGCDNVEVLRIAAKSAPEPLRERFAVAVSQFDSGARLDDALGSIVRSCGSTLEPLVGILGNAERLGIPISATIERLADDARVTRRHVTESSARELPVQLTLPVVACVLPSFVLVVIVPVVLGTFADLRHNF